MTQEKGHPVAGGLHCEMLLQEIPDQCILSVSPETCGKIS